MDNKTKSLHAITVGAIIAVIFVMIITIAGELFSPLKSLLKEAHQHHWVGKGVWSIIIFVVVSGIFYFTGKHSGNTITSRLLNVLSWILILSALALFVFFIYEFYAHIKN